MNSLPNLDKNLDEVRGHMSSTLMFDGFVIILSYQLL